MRFKRARSAERICRINESMSPVTAVVPAAAIGDNQTKELKMNWFPNPIDLFSNGPQGAWFGYGIECALVIVLVGLARAMVARFGKNERDADKRNLSDELRLVGTVTFIAAAIAVFIGPMLILVVGVVGALVVLVGVLWGLGKLGGMLFGLMGRSGQAKSAK